ncbi:hypothetical protein L840_3392 [Mycobacterium sp. MAC_011194_8550]|nr:hypothetical protein L840_3392 [Mycobacterium sp. MAC_011194_8550]
MTNLNPVYEPDFGKFVELATAIWPGATIYPGGTRFRVRDHDDLGYSIPAFARGRTGTVVTVEGPVALSGDIHGRKADVEGISAIGLGDVLDLLGVIVEMVHVVEYDDDPGVAVRLSHLWMEPVADSVDR